jgi:hypothetical protein
MNASRRHDEQHMTGWLIVLTGLEFGIAVSAD